MVPEEFWKEFKAQNDLLNVVITSEENVVKFIEVLQKTILNNITVKNVFDFSR